jgi:hypothetical protein
MHNPTVPRSERIARKAEEASSAGPTTARAGFDQAMRPGTLRNNLGSQTCWNAVIDCARRADAISNARARSLQFSTSRTNWTGFVPPDAPDIRTPYDLDDVPRGSFIAFLERTHEGLVLIHAMVYLGVGWAAGSNNAVVGGSPAWDRINLATELHWGGNLSIVLDRRRQVLLKYRYLESLTHSSCVVM